MGPDGLTSRLARPVRIPASARALVIAVAATTLVYWRVLIGLAADWARVSTQSHGFAIPVVAAYLIWMRRSAVAAALADPPPGRFDVGFGLGLAALVAALGAHVIGSLTAEAFLSQASLPVALLGVVLVVGGLRALRPLWIGLAYLIFMVPLPYVAVKTLTYRSRLFDASATATALRWLGVPVYQDGVMLHLANITLEVADACSSVPAIAALIALGIAYAHLRPRPASVRVTLALSAAPLALAANIVRLILTSLAAYALGPVALRSIVHQFSGTTVFLATILLLVVLDRLLTRPPRDRGR